MQCFRLILLIEEISKQPHIDAFMWILGVTLMKIYNKEKAEQGKTFGEKKDTRK